MQGMSNGEKRRGVRTDDMRKTQNYGYACKKFRKEKNENERNLHVLIH